MLFAEFVGLANHLLADYEKFSLERILIGAVVTAAHEELAHERLGRLDALAQTGVVDGNVAPAEHLLSFGLDNAFDDPFAVRPGPGGLGHEQHPDAIFARRRQLDADIPASRPQMFVGHLDENAGAIASARVSPDRTPVGEVFQDLQTLADYLVTLSVLYVRDKADSASVVLIARVVESLFFG